MAATETDVVISDVTKHMLLWRKETREVLAALLGMHPKTFNKRMAGNASWEAWEIKKMADHFGVPVSRFYEGTDGLFTAKGGTAMGRKPALSRSPRVAA